MTSDGRKRPPLQTECPAPKRRRMTSSQTLVSEGEAEVVRTYLHAPTTDDVAKNGLRRGIALALNQVGFEAASPEALESFTAMTETYLTSFVEDVRAFSNAARRNQPIPPDFEAILERFNLPISALQPHLKPPVPRRKREPQWILLPLDENGELKIPYLGEELSGRPDKEAKSYIPQSFPEFPSIHTYKYTPEAVEAVTVPDDWTSALAAAADEAPGSSQTIGSATTANNTQASVAVASTSPAPKPRPPLLPHEIPRGDAKKLREAAAKESKLGEEALRRLMRASKIAKQKEVWAVAQRDAARKARMDLWGEAMRELLDEDRGAPLAHGAGARVEIADHSMVVNADTRFHRREGGRGKGTLVLGRFEEV